MATTACSPSLFPYCLAAAQSFELLNAIIPFSQSQSQKNPINTGQSNQILIDMAWVCQASCFLDVE